MPDCERCPMEPRVMALEGDKDRNSAQHKEFYDQFKQIAVAQGKSDTVQAQILTTLARIETDIATIKEKPSKRWDSIIAAIIASVVAFIVGYALKGGV